MPARGNEKPDAEGTVKAVQRRFATPVPRVADREELNAHFRRLCRAEQARTVQSLAGPFVIGARFAEECAAAGRLPERAFAPCVEPPAVVADKYQTVAFDGNRYSVPRLYAFQAVTVKGYIDRVVVVARGQVIASHPRCYGRQPPVLDPIHFLPALSRKPAALDRAPVYRDWDLPAAFTALRAELERRHGALAGARQFIRVLQLLGEHPRSRVEQAIEACRRDHLGDVEAIVQRAQSLAASDPEPRGVADARGIPATVPRVEVPRPDLGRFNRLLTSGVPDGDGFAEGGGVTQKIRDI
jgi:hypothetical protein